jgi:predicted ferric reductase
MNEIFQTISSALSLDSTHVFWYITRSAGIMAYLLLWLSTVWGIIVAAKPLDRFLSRLYNFDLHEFLSLLAIGFTLVHVVVLLWDSYAPFSMIELIIPFAATYRTFWTALGIVSLDLAVLVTVTFYLRQRIGYKAFRSLHYLSFIAYFGATLHGIFSGTDSSLASTRFMYFETALAVILLTIYWLWQRRSKPQTLKPLPVENR